MVLSMFRQLCVEEYNDLVDIFGENDKKWRLGEHRRRRQRRPAKQRRWRIAAMKTKISERVGSIQMRFGKKERRHRQKKRRETRRLLRRMARMSAGEVKGSVLGEVEERVAVVHVQDRIFGVAALERESPILKE
ncbi:hypothetical protein HID58_032811 [Brassica napus]|uniref:Uncharacterized protein n=1 Tax=Brassica napus TaxID=3708 RepID=A0ABQ8BYY8_BRANA|nr:hypothetical protein HID58_032811 [Brassica napus]